MRTFQQSEKRMLPMSQWKDLVSSYEGDNLLNKVQNLLISNELCSINCLLRTSVDTKSVDIKTSSPFCSMIAKTKSCIFTGIFLAVFPPTQSFLFARLMFWLLRFPKQKLNSSMQQFHWRKWRVIFSVNMTRNWCHPFVCILLLCNFDVIL